MATQATMVVLSPIVVEIAREFDATVGAVGQARTINAAAAVAGSLAVGPVIDRLGVRPLLMVGALFAATGAVLSAVAPSLELLYAAQAIAGLGVAGLLSAGFAGVAASFAHGERAWAMGYVVGAQAVAWIVGVPLIGALAQVDWRFSFAVPLGAAVIAASVAATMMPRLRDDEREEGAGASGPLAVLRSGSARTWTLVEILAYAAWTAEITYIGAFYIETYGITPVSVGLLMAGGSAVFAATTLRTADLLRHVERRRAISVAALGMAIALPIGFNVAPAVAFTFAAFATMALFAGVRSTSSSGLGLAQLPDSPGSMMAARTGSAQLGYIIGAGLGGLLIDAAGYEALGFALGIIMLASAALVLRVEDPHLGPELEPPGAALPETVD